MYKIIQNNKVIDVVRIPRFVSFLPSGHVAITDKTSAHGIVGSDGKTLYGFAPIKERHLEIVTIEQISLEEFNRLNGLLNSGQDVSADESALALAKQSKIKSLSGQCKYKITSGFSIELSDGIVHNFRLTTEDQLNLMLLENQLANGDEFFIYHATDEPCCQFSREDMIKVVQAAKRHMLYHTTYFNVAKQYVKSLTDIEKVNLFSYGQDISEFEDNVVLKQILKNGGCY